MPNVDQCRSKFWHWSKCQSIPINTDQFLSMPLNASQCLSMPDQAELIRYWSALIGNDRYCSALISIGGEKLQEIHQWQHLTMPCSENEKFSLCSAAATCNVLTVFTHVLMIPCNSSAMIGIERHFIGGGPVVFQYSKREGYTIFLDNQRYWDWIIMVANMLGSAIFTGRGVVLFFCEDQNVWSGTPGVSG